METTVVRTTLTRSSWHGLTLSIIVAGLLSLIMVGAFAESHSDEDNYDPIALFLTWQSDPLTTMIIDWHAEEEQDRELHFRRDDQTDWQETSAETIEFPYSNRTIYRVELTGLLPGTRYAFRFGEDSVEYAFRTMPENALEPVRFAVGGDTRHRQDWMEATNKQAQQLDVDFIVWGGDLAYADGREDRVYRWYEWFDAIKNTLITDDGRVIPVLVGIGNHEVRGGYYYNHDEYEQTDAWRENLAPYFYALFAWPGQPGYGVMDFGNYLSIVMGDTDHSNPVEGVQTEWWNTVLAERRHVPHVFPVYHVAAYPSVRSFDGGVQTRIREHWAPLFEEHGIQIVFENHDHTYKRTPPIRNGEIHEEGIVYLGDGTWGVDPRNPYDAEEVWYLAKTRSVHHLILVTIQGNHQHFAAVDSTGKIFDAYPHPGNAFFELTP